MSSDGDSQRPPSPPSPSRGTSPCSEECGKEVPGSNDEGSLETTNECDDLQDCESRKEEKPEGNKLEKGSDSGNPISEECDGVNTRLNLKSSPEEVGQSELTQEEKEKVSEHNFKMDGSGANSIVDSSLNKDEAMGDDQLTQNEPVHEEVSEETTKDAHTEMGSKEIQVEEMDRDNETKNQTPGKETEEAGDQTVKIFLGNAESEVNQKETECQSQAKKTVTDIQDAANQSSTTMDSQPSASAADKRQERMRKLHELRLRKNEARKLNHVEVIEEAKRNKRPSNWEARKRKVEWEAAEEEARKQAELDGEDYEKMKQMETSALELERREKKKMRKKNPDQGFSDFAQAQHRQYERLTKQMEPDMVAYEKTKMEMGESFYPGVNTIIHGHKPSESAIDKMVQDLDKQMEKRAKFSRRRGINEDADVDYINDRNMRFNKKAARFYDQYTLETKQNLERGTAV